MEIVVAIDGRQRIDKLNGLSASGTGRYALSFSTRRNAV
jgi:hypothetical protein